MYLEYIQLQVIAKVYELILESATLHLLFRMT